MARGSKIYPYGIESNRFVLKWLQAKYSGIENPLNKATRLLVQHLFGHVVRLRGEIYINKKYVRFSLIYGTRNFI